MPFLLPLYSFHHQLRAQSELSQSELSSMLQEQTLGFTGVTLDSTPKIT